MIYIGVLCTQFCTELSLEGSEDLFHTLLDLFIGQRTFCGTEAHGECQGE